MGSYSSPGVYTKEKDISSIVPNVSSSPAALVGYSAKGDINKIRLITSTRQFIEEYGKPTVGQYFHYTALAFLQNGKRLFCYRTVNGALYGGAVVVKSTAINDNSAFSQGALPLQYESWMDAEWLFLVFAKDPGVWNNNLTVKITNIDAVEKTFTISVYDKDDDGNNALVETWDVSRQKKVDGYGRQLYLENKINDFSNYIVVVDNTSEVDTVLPKEQATLLSFANGSDGSAVTDSEIINGWDKFINPDDIDVRLLIGGGYATPAVHSKIKTVAETRGDCLAILEVPYSALTSVSNIINWRTDDQNLNSSYCALYAPWVEIYDSYNDVIVTVPPSGYVASQIAYNDYIANPWFAPAGFNRGLLNILGLTNVFTQGERDSLYEKQVNPLQTFRGEGNPIWGQKTQQVKASALDRINVRRLIIILKKSVALYLRQFLFEPNNALTRFRVSTTIEQYLDTLSAGGAFSTTTDDPKGYLVLCDETNNTPDVIDRNEMRVDLFIKPVRVAEFIQLQVIITQTGIAFEELVARGVQF